MASDSKKRPLEDTQDLPAKKKIQDSSYTAPRENESDSAVNQEIRQTDESDSTVSPEIQQKDDSDSTANQEIRQNDESDSTVSQEIRQNDDFDSTASQEIHKEEQQHFDVENDPFYDKVYLYLSQNIGKEWTGVLIQLEIENARIEQYDMDCKFTEHKILRGLQEWNKRRKSVPMKDRMTELFDALKSEELQSLVEKVSKEFNLKAPDEEYMQVEEELPSDVSLQASREEDDVGALSDVEMIEETKDDGVVDIMLTDTEESPVSVDEKCAHVDKEIDMRNYQRELAYEASKGNNSIILAGTGSGKTRVAIYLMKQHLDHNKEGRIIFMATTVPLVGQQCKAIKRLLPDRYKNAVCKASGEDDTAKTFHFLFNNGVIKVIVMTPQLLVNSLKDGRISLSELSLLIFDECHHTRKDHPYNVVMQQYRKCKKSRDQGRLPQIVGLTASFGTDNAVVQRDAVNSLLKLMTRLDVKKLSAVVKYKEDYEKHVVVADSSSEEMITKTDDKIKFFIEEQMGNIEEQLQLSEFDTYNEEAAAHLQRIPDDDRSSDIYQSWLGKLLSLATQMLTDPDHRKEARFALACHAHLKVYFGALEVNMNLNPNDVAIFLLKQISQDYFTRSEESQEKEEKQMIEDFRDLRKKIKIELMKKVENPNCMKLVKMLQDVIQDKGTDTRFIVFVKTKAIAKALSQFLKKNKGIKTDYVIGHSSNEEAQTSAEQNKIVESFRRGAINGIVSTTVLQEGFDMPSCNVVIRYNTVGNEISRVQTRGRSRKIGGKEVLLGDRKNILKEYVNMEREAMMTLAVDETLKMNQEEIESKIEQFEQHLIAKEEQADALSQNMWQSKSQEEFDLQCGLCGKNVISKSGLASMENRHVVAVDPMFYQKITYKKHEKPCFLDIFDKRYKMHGKCCEHDWGIGALLRKGDESTRCAVLKLSSFVDKNTGSRFNKLKDCPYNIPPISEFNAIECIRSINKSAEKP